MSFQPWIRAARLAQHRKKAPRRRQTPDTRLEVLEQRQMLSISATDDAFLAGYDSAVSGNVRGNDVAGTAAFLLNNPSKGSLGGTGLQTNGSFTYTPGIHFVGTDSFSYMLTDASESPRIVPSDPTNFAAFGDALAISGDFAVVGAFHDPTAGTNSGAAYVFQRTPSGWTQQAKLVPTGITAGAQFGYSVAIDGRRILIGAPFDTAQGQSQGGSVWAYEFDGATWNKTSVITLGPGVPVSTDWFGRSVAIDGDRAVIGAPNRDDAGVNSGSAYVYTASYDYTKASTSWNYYQRLTATDGAAGDFFGTSVALDGGLLAVGANGDDNTNPANSSQTFGETGSVYVYSQGASSWTQSWKLLAGDRAANDQLGWSVAISGTRVIAGARNATVAGAANAGAAYLFEQTGATWFPTKLVASDAAADNNFGYGVGIDGDTVVVGGYGRDQSTFQDLGAAYVYRKIGTAWPQTNELITNIGQTLVNGAFAVAAIDGTTVLSGLPYANDPNPDSGSVAVFQLYQDIGNVTVETLSSAMMPAAADDVYAFSEDTTFSTGNVLTNDRNGSQPYVSRAPEHANPSSGFTFNSNGTFSYQPASNYSGTDAFTYTLAELLERKKSNPNTPPDPASLFGFSVALDGDTAVVGAPYEDIGGNASVGAAYVYQWDGSTWVYQLKLAGSSAGDLFGYDVAINKNRIVVGAFGRDTNGQSDAGAAYVYEHSGTTWLLKATLIASTPAADDWFGRSVSIQGDTIAVGAPVDDVGALVNAGSVSVFTWNGADWERKSLVAGDGVAGDQFGMSVSVDGDRVAVGANADDSVAGSAYVYKRTGGTWSQEGVKLLAGDRVAGDQFGRSISLSGTQVVIGAPYHLVVDQSSVNQPAAGAAYVFQFGGTNWTQAKELTASDGVANDNFGFDVGLEGDTVVVGAYQNDNSGKANDGAAYVFRGAGSSWTQRHKLVTGSPVSNTNGGYATAAVWGDQILVGIPWDSAVGANTGSVSFYEFQNGSVLLNVLPANTDLPSSVALPAVAAAEDDPDKVIELSSYFSDVDLPGGEALTYSATSADTTRVVPTVQGNKLVLHYQKDQTTSAAVAITVQATDSAGHAATPRSFNVTISAVDDKPSVARLSAAHAAVVGSNLTVTASGVVDPDNTVTGVVFFRDLNGNGAYDAATDGFFADGVYDTNTKLWSATKAAPTTAGQIVMSAVATSGAGGSAQTSNAASAVIELTSAAPQLDPIEDRQIDLGRSLVFQPHAFSPTGAVITYTISPDQGTFKASSNFVNGVFSWTPTAADIPSGMSKTYTFTVTASTGTSPNNLTDSETFSVDVTKAQKPEYANEIEVGATGTTADAGKRTIVQTGTGLDVAADVDFTIYFNDADSADEYLQIQLGEGSSLPSGVSFVGTTFVATSGHEGKRGAHFQGSLTPTENNYVPPAGYNIFLKVTDAEGDENVEHFYFDVKGWVYGLLNGNQVGSPMDMVATDDEYSVASGYDAILLEVYLNDAYRPDWLRTGSQLTTHLEVGGAKNGSNVQAENYVDPVSHETWQRILFTPGPGFRNKGWEEFTYWYVSGGPDSHPSSMTSNAATVRVEWATQGRAFDYTVCDCDCGCNLSAWQVDPSSGDLTLKQSLASVGGGDFGAPQLRYSLAAVGTTLVGLDFFGGQAYMPATGGFSAEVKFQNMNVVLGTAWYTINPLNIEGLREDEAFRLSYLLDGRGSGTGHYPVEIALKNGSTPIRTYNGYGNVLNRSGSEFGAGWTLDGLDRLYITKDGSNATIGALLSTGDDDFYWMPYDATKSTFQQADEDPFGRTLTITGSDWQLTDKDGGFQVFAGSSSFSAAPGLLLSRSDRLGNVTTYTYLDQDTDGAKDELTSITDYAGRAMTFKYTGGLVSSITGSGGDSVSLGYSSGQLTSVSHGDPDGGGAEQATTSRFTYTTVNGSSVVTKFEEGLGSTYDNEYNFEYNAGALRVQRVTGAGGVPLLSVTPPELANLVALSSGGTQLALGRYMSTLGSVSNPLPIQPSSGTAVGPSGSSIDALGKVTEFRTDDQGRPVSVTDPLGNTTSWERNGYGLPTKQMEPDAGSRQLDDSDTAGVSFSSGWTTVTTGGQKGNYRTAVANGAATAQWQFTGLTAGATYEVVVSTVQGAFATNEKFQVFDGNGTGAVTTTGYVNEAAPQRHPALGKGWHSLGSITVSGATLTIKLAASGADGLVVADSVRLIERPTTTFAYDARSNLTGLTLPDGTKQSWTYDSTYNQPLTFVDDVGGANRTTKYALYPSNTASRGNVQSVTQVVGGDDSVTSEHDDLVTSFTYTSPATNVPAGLVDVITDPLGRLTDYDYYTTSQDAGRAQRITTGAHTADVATVQFVYDTAGNVTKMTDPLGKVTQYTYDSLGNALTAQAPDGAVTSYLYGHGHELEQITDPLGRVTRMQYNRFHQVEQVIEPDPDGGGPLFAPTTLYFYTLTGLLSAVVDPLGRKTTYTYDDAGRQLSVIQPDPDGGGSAYISPVTQYVYDGAGRLKQLIQPDPDGNGSAHSSQVTTYGYDKLGQLVSTTLSPPASGQPAATQTYVYNSLGQLLSTADPLGNLTSYGYDSAGRLQTVTLPDPDGPTNPLTRPVTTYGYDSAGNQTSVTDAGGGVTKYTYDAQNRLVKVSEPYPSDRSIDDGDAIPAYREVEGTWTSATGGQGNDYRWADAYNTDPLHLVPSAVAQWQFTGLDPNKKYEVVVSWVANAANADNTPYQVFNGDGSGTAFPTVNLNQKLAPAHPDLGSGWQAVGIFTITGSTLTVRMNNVGASGKVVADSVRVLEARPETKFAYDAAGQLVSQTDPLGRVTSYLYDSVGQRIAVLSADPDFDGPDLAPITNFYYDAAGQQVGTLDRLGNSTAATFDGLGRMVTSVDAKGQVTKFGYDLVGNRTSLTDPQNNDTVWTYDGLNRVTTETNELNKVRSFTYDGMSRVLRQTNRDNRYRTFGYDEWGRQVEEKWYDASNNLKETLTFGYDAGNRLTTATSGAANYTFTPDGLGRNTQIVNSITGVASAVTLVQLFDNRNNRTQLTASIGSTLDFKNTYTYDALSRNVQIVQQGQTGGNTVLAKRVNLAYDAAGELQKLSRYADTAGTQLVSTSDYAFDRLGRLTFLQHSQANREIASYRMAYDVLDRLTRLDDAIDEVSLYGYDTLGQLTTADHTFENDESYAYDANGNRTGAGYDTSVSNNQLDSDPNYNYTFDAEGNRASRTSKATGNIEEYAYDQRNRLTDVTFKNSAGTVVRALHYDYDGFDRKVARKVGTASAEYYVYDGDDVVLDFLDGDGTGPNPAALAERYLFGPAVDQVLAQENVVSGAGQTVLWHLTDNLGSVRDLVRSDGTTAAHYQYDAFGNLLDGYEDQTRYQFTGRERDPDTGLQYNRARWYDPQSGQWMSEDPIGFSAGDANLRRYVGNGVTNATDPSGNAIAIVQRPRDQYLDQLNQAIKDAPTGPERARLEAERDRYLESKKFWGDIQTGMDLSGFMGVIYTGPTALGRLFGWCRGTLGFTDDAAKLGGGGGKLPGGADPAPPVPVPPVQALPIPPWVNDAGSFVNWMKNLQKEFLKNGAIPCADDIERILEMAKKHGVEVRFDPPHPGTNWDIPHFNIGQNGQAHVPSPPGYKPPPWVPIGSPTRPKPL